VLPGQFAERPVFVTLDDRSGSKAPIRFLKQRPFDQLFTLAGVPNLLPICFGDFLATRAASSYVCCAFRPAIPDAIVLRHVWPELGRTETFE
jgi:hypothetical protein